VLLAGAGGGRLPCQIASITKVMTAHLVLRIVAREVATNAAAAGAAAAAAAATGTSLLDELVLVSPEAAALQGTSADLRAGEVYTVRDLLYGMMLPSGNDAAAALAEYVGDMFEPPPTSAAPSTTYARKARDHPHTRFVHEMNREAARLGLSLTRFGNPHGLSDTRQQSCAADVCKLAAVVLRDPLFRAIVDTPTYATTARAVPSKLMRIGKWAYPGAPGGGRRVYPCAVEWVNTNMLLGSTVRASVDAAISVDYPLPPPTPAVLLPRVTGLPAGGGAPRTTTAAGAPLPPLRAGAGGAALTQLRVTPTGTPTAASPTAGMSAAALGSSRTGSAEVESTVSDDTRLLHLDAASTLGSRSQGASEVSTPIMLSLSGRTPAHGPAPLHPPPRAHPAGLLPLLPVSAPASQYTTPAGTPRHSCHTSPVPHPPSSFGALPSGAAAEGDALAAVAVPRRIASRGGSRDPERSASRGASRSGSRSGSRPSSHVRASLLVIAPAGGDDTAAAAGSPDSRTGSPTRRAPSRSPSRLRFEVRPDADDDGSSDGEGGSGSGGGGGGSGHGGSDEHSGEEGASPTASAGGGRGKKGRKRGGAKKGRTLHASASATVLQLPSPGGSKPRPKSAGARGPRKDSSEAAGGHSFSGAMSPLTPREAEELDDALAVRAAAAAAVAAAVGSPGGMRAHPPSEPPAPRQLQSPRRGRSTGDSGAPSPSVASPPRTLPPPPAAAAAPPPPLPAVVPTGWGTAPLRVSRDVAYVYEGVKTGITPVAGGCLCTSLRLLTARHSFEAPTGLAPGAAVTRARALLPSYDAPTLAPPPAAATEPPPPYSQLIITVLGSECKTMRFVDTQAIAAYAVRVLQHRALAAAVNAAVATNIAAMVAAPVAPAACAPLVRSPAARVVAPRAWPYDLAAGSGGSSASSCSSGADAPSPDGRPGLPLASFSFAATAARLMSRGY